MYPCGSRYTSKQKNKEEKTGNTCLCHRETVPLQPIIPQRVRRSAP